MKGLSTEEEEVLYLEDFRSLISDLFVAKLRASFNSPKESFGGRMISRDSLFREKLKNKNRGEKRVKEIGQKLSPWHSSDFSLDFSPISDLNFECSNIKMLEEIDDLTTYRVLKARAFSEEESKEISCRNCIENRHDLEFEDDLIRRFSEYWPTNCALNPNAKKYGLGMIITVGVTIDEHGRIDKMEIPIEGFQLSDRLTREIRGSSINTQSIVPLLGDNIPSWQGIKLVFKQLAEVSTNEVSKIWRKEGYRERLVFRGIGNIGRRSPKNSPEGPAVSSSFVVRTLLDIIKEIEKSWDPSAFGDPRFFLQSGIDLDSIGSRAGWPVQFIQ